MKYYFKCARPATTALHAAPDQRAALVPGRAVHSHSAGLPADPVAPAPADRQAPAGRARPVILCAPHVLLLPVLHHRLEEYQV